MYIYEDVMCATIQVINQMAIVVELLKSGYMEYYITITLRFYLTKWLCSRNTYTIYKSQKESF